MNEDLRTLIEQGLYEENLQTLAQLCKGLFAESPAVYGTLAYIFQSLAEEFDHQGIATCRYELISATIKQPVLLLLKVENNPAVVLDRLNEVFRAFAVLNR